MKKLAAILCLGALTTGAFAQGLVTFANTGITQISTTPAGGTAAAFSASPVGSYYFGLLTAATAAGPFTFTGITATNTAGAGRFGPPGYTPSVATWAPGVTMSYEVAGWSASLGAVFNPNWLTGTFAPGSTGFFGVSPSASGAAGGGSPVPAPALPLFGGTGLQGFNMNAVGVPEPTSMALAGLGAAALLIFRRRK
jgi:hypothetical protein